MSGVAANEAESPLVLALDVGSSSVRCIVYDAAGRSVAGPECHRPYELETTPDGGATLNADRLLEQACQCLDAVLEGLGERAGDIKAVACDTFWHSVLGVADGGSPVTPVLTWADTRSATASRELCERLDEGAVHARTGALLHPSYLPAKLLWLRQSDASAARSAAYWMSIGEYLYLRFFGERKVSISMASGTGLFDQHRCVWDEDVLAELPIDQEQLSPIAEYTDALSGLRTPFDTRWPALAKVPWYLALGDGACNNVGSGGHRDDRIVVMVGTSGALRVVREAKEFQIPRGLWSYRVDARRIIQGGALSSGGNVFAWFTTLLHFGNLDALEARLCDMDPDGHGLTILPFLAGERSPSWNPNAESAIIGATLDTTDVEMVRATLESVAYRFADVFDILKHTTPHVRTIVGSGAGLVHSPAWTQIVADVFGEPITICAAAESTSRGAALLGLQALGVLDDLDQAPVPLGRRFEPTAANTKIYRQAMRRQDDLYHRLLE